MKKLNITKEAFEKSKHFQRKYGKLEYVSESGKLFKTNKGHVIKFVRESEDVEPNPLKTKFVKKAKQAIGWAIDILDQAAEEVKNAAGETFLYARLDYHARDLDKTLDELSAILNKDSDAKASVNESNDGSAWFDERGDFLKPLPGDCILACSGQGRVDDDVAFWVDELGFANGLPRELAINFLKEYGAWEEDELNDMTLKSLAEKVLWIYCGDLKEEAYDMVGQDKELAEKLGDDPSAWGDEEWEYFQKEYSYCSLNY